MTAPAVARRLGRLSALLMVPRTARWVVAGFIVLLVLQALLVQQGLQRLRDIGTMFDHVARTALPAQQHAHEMQRAAQARIMLLLRMLAQPDPFEREADAQAFVQEGLAFGRARDALLALALDDATQTQLQRIQQQAVALSQRQRAMSEALLQGRDDEARALLEQQRLFDVQRELVQQLQALAQRMQQQAQADQQRALEAQRSAERIVLMLGASLFALGVAIGVAVTRLVARAERLLLLDKERAEAAACRDPLTGLYNRRGFEQARELLLRASPNGTPHSLLLIDLDHFKPVNDTAGHDAGDALLRRLAQLLRDQVRPQDIVARLGGDEFAVVLVGLDADQATQVGQRIRDAVADFSFEWGGRTFRLGTSIGVATVLTGAAEAAWSHAMKAADEACYEAKRRGRGQVVGAADVATPATGVQASVA